MEQINNNNGCCATCVYWLGSRFPNRLGYVEVESRMVHGVCAKHDISEQYSKQATYKCCHYLKWNVLK